METAELNALVDRLLAGIEAGDVEQICSCYTDDVEIWHNFDQATQGVDENLATLGWMVERLTDRRYDIVRREVFADGTGLFQQHVLRGTVVPSGTPFELPAVLVIGVRAGKVCRIEEYLDTAQAAVLSRRR